MKRLVYIATAAVAISIASCTDGTATTDNTGTDSDTVVTDLPVDSSAVQEVTGVVVDGARRSIDLQVGDSTINFELTSSEDVSWEIGDTLTVRYYMTRENGDSVVEVLDHQM